MADTKITALAAITTVDPAADVLPIVDISDTSMAASGTTKKITSNQILGAGGTATLASATITGDLTVDTSTLKVDSANDRVGIVQATPLYPLHLVGEFGLQEASPAGTGTKLRFIGDATKYNFRLGKQLTATNTFEITPSTAVGGTTFSNPVYTVSYDGIHTFLDGAGGTRMTLNANGLGIGIAGASIAGKLDVDVGAGGFGYFRSSTYSNLQINGRSGGAGSGGCQLFLTTTGSRSWLVGQRTDTTYASGSSFFIRDDTASATRLEIDTSGRVLVGSTSAFSDLTGSKEVKIGDGGMQTLTVASLPAATATNIARGGVGGLVYVGGYNGTGQYGAVVLWTAASATVVSVINGTGSTITFGVSAGFLQITSSLVLTQVTASCIRL